MKVCTTCKLKKDLSLYSPDKRAKDGRQSRCKACYVEIRQRAEEKEKARNWWQSEKGRQVSRDNAKRYRKENPEKIKNITIIIINQIK